ncbi:hypothetical protein TNCV_4388891 [Trichonephila clavipes]|nr:hypothetical protein TNCV_4388891 [Trichonephila clavipes]
MTRPYSSVSDGDDPRCFQAVKWSLHSASYLALRFNCGVSRCSVGRRCGFGGRNQWGDGYDFSGYIAIGL